MVRQVILPEVEIQTLERMDEAQVGGWIFEKGTAKAAQKIVSFLRSYRIAATGANVAWKLLREIDTTGGISAETVTELRAAMSLYSPSNFPPLQSDLAYACRVLEETYDYLSQWARPDMGLAMLEQLFNRILEFRQMLG